ncbi:uncharacterized protein BHQ10_006864 [Talaromyces amestolkiae]|uniref:SAP domain-containing protein n=1 Tax=Talaromyces amestolkiae TaxID=1196081 RepID=A0A364L4Y5_TALAM|nr:uncharacterized protein BHQ10_006864 [Talaromyces amestolkiae]RAO70852.1 hypothetical protein BHQ10_006864 [Talaromyces amestolkiae]
MSDYSKWKVTELKAELKNRGVPQTGLRLKQDFIDKLIELDSQSSVQPAAKDASTELTAEKEGNQTEQKSDADQKTDEPAPPSQQSGTEILPTESAPSTPKVTAQLDQPSDDLKKAQIEPNDARSEATQPTQQTTNDRPTQSKEAEPDTAADSQTIKLREPIVPAQPEGPAPENQTPEEPPTLAEVSRKNQGLDSEPPTDGGDDLRKRKRRSQSPPPTVEVVKKSKIDNEDPRVILKEDVHPRETTSEIVRPESKIETSSTGRQDPRFRDLLTTTKPPKSVQYSEQTLEDDDVQVEPALHPATSSIYIRNLMRPLQPSSLKNHLQELATPAGEELGGEPLVDFFLDSIKTHCFALFDTVTTASRVRSKLHGAIWPNERDRKPLWVDFIPDGKFSEWVRTEQDIAAGRGTQRWEVLYEKTEDGVQAILQDARNGARSGHQPTVSARRHSPDAESRRENRPSRAPPAQQQSGGKGFQALDDLFKSTKTKPKLYYLPVSRDIVDKRLAQFDTLIRKGARHSGKEDEDMRRITFEDTNMFVDGGPEYPRTRGGGGGGGRRGGRGSWRGQRR